MLLSRKSIICAFLTMTVMVLQQRDGCLGMDNNFYFFPTLVW
jgi:hypothetical protein